MYLLWLHWEKTLRTWAWFPMDLGPLPSAVLFAVINHN